MRLDRTASGFRLAEDEEVYLDFSQNQYEDIYYALPQEPANLYMLVNDTVLVEADDRAILQFIVEAAGGVNEAMRRLQELVQALPPKPEEGAAPAEPAAAVVEAAPAPAPAKGPGGVDEPLPVDLAAEGEVPFEITEPAAVAAPAPPPPPEVTKKIERRPPPPVVVQIQDPPKRVKISCGNKVLDLGVARYEDLFYALPGQNASIFRLINDTILTRPEERDLLKDMVNLLGGVDEGMTAIQNAVLKVEPPKKISKPPAVKPSEPPKVGSKPPVAAGKPATALPGQLKPGATPAKPATALPGQIKPGAAPAKPAAGPGKPGAPARPTGPRPITVSETDDVELVDDVEVLPVAPVETGRPGAPPAAAPARPAAGPGVKTPGPMSKPAAGAPAKPGQPQTVAPGKTGQPATLSPAARRKKEVDRPQGKTELKMSKEDVDRTGVKLKVVPNVGYQIICKEYFIQLSKAQYQELFYALPMPVMGMFKLVHNDLLKDPGSRGVLMKMIHLAGGPKDFMTALSVQVQNVKPTEDWQ